MKRTNEKKRNIASTRKQVRALDGMLLLKTLLVVSLVLPSLWAVRSWQVWRTAPVLLQRAADLEKTSEHMAAAEYIRRYLKLRPDDNDARIRLAGVYANGVDSTKTRERAVELFYEAIGVAGQDDQLLLRVKLAEILLEIERFTSARTEAETLLILEPRHAAALRSLALAVYGQLRTGVLSSGRDKLTLVGQTCLEAIRENPGDRHVAGVLAFAYRERPELLPAAQRNADAKTRAGWADQVMDELVAADNQNSAPYLTRHLYRTRYQLPGVLDDLKSALERTDDDLETHLIAARYYHSQAVEAKADERWQDFEETTAQAINFYDLIITDISPQSEIAFAELGELHLMKSGTAAAIECWNNGIASIGENSPLLNLYLAESFVAESNLQEARHHIDVLKRVLVEKDVNQRLEMAPVVTLLEAKLLIKGDEYQQALSLLQRLNEGTTNRPMLLAQSAELQGQVYSELNEWERAAAAYESALRLRPLETQSLWFAATAWNKANYSDRAIERYQQLLKRTNTPEVWFALARAEYERQLLRTPRSRNWSRVRAALQSLEQAKNKATLDEPWRVELLAADLIFIESRSDAATADVESAEQQLQNKQTQALTMLRQVESKYANAARLFEELATVFQKLSATDDADRALEKLRLLTRGGRSWEITLARVTHLRGDWKSAKQLLEKSLANCPTNERPVLYREIVSIDMQRQSFEDAVENLVRWRELKPDDSQARRTLAQALVGIGGDENWSQAIALLSPSETTPNQSANDMRLKGYILYQRGRVEDRVEATRIFDILANHSMNSVSNDYLMLAKLLESQTQNGAAQRQYLLLLASPDPQPDHLVAYLEFLLKQKPIRDVSHWLNKLRQLEPESLRTASLDARIALVKGRPIDSTAMNRIAEDEFTNLGNKRRKAAFCLTVGNLFNDLELPIAAEKWHRRLFSLQPDSSGPLALTLARQNKLAEAIKLCRDSEHNGDSNSTPKILASVLAVAASPSPSDLENTMPLIERSLKEHPADADLIVAVANLHIMQGNNSKAIAMYRKAVGLRPDDALALNNLATLLVENRAQLNEGLKYIYKAISLAGPQPDLLDTLGMLLLCSGRPVDALPVLKRAVQSGQDDPRFYFHLWAAYCDSGQHQNAQQTLEQIDVSKLETQMLMSPDRARLQELKNMVNTIVRVAN